METFSALLTISAGNSPVPGEFPTQRPVTRSFGVFFDLRLNKRLSKRSWGWWFETHRAHYDIFVMNNNGTDNDTDDNNNTPNNNNNCVATLIEIQIWFDTDNTGNATVNTILLARPLR